MGILSDVRLTTARSLQTTSEDKGKREGFGDWERALKGVEGHTHHREIARTDRGTLTLPSEVKFSDRSPK